VLAAGGASLPPTLRDAVLARAWREVGVPVKVGDSCRWLSRLSWFLGKNADADACAREALAVLEPMGPGPPLAWAYSNLAQIHMLAGRAGEAVEWGERAIAVAQDLGDHEVLCHALNNVGTARSHVEDDDAGIALVERSLAIALELGFEEHVARAYTNLGSSSVSTRRLPAARRHLQAGIDYSTEHDLDSWRLYMTGWLAVCELWEGRYAEAVRVAGAMLGHPRLAVPSRIQPLVVLGRVRTRRGDPEAKAVLDEALALAANTGELQRVGPVRAARAEAAWLAGDLEAACAEVTAAFELAVARQDPWMIGELGFWLWRAGGLSSAPPRAARRLTRSRATGGPAPPPRSGARPGARARRRWRWPTSTTRPRCARRMKHWRRWGLRRWPIEWRDACGRGECATWRAGRARPRGPTPPASPPASWRCCGW